MSITSRTQSIELPLKRAVLLDVMLTQNATVSNTISLIQEPLTTATSGPKIQATLVTDQEPQNAT
jgi:hypothetical protein